METVDAARGLFARNDHGPSHALETPLDPPDHLVLGREADERMHWIDRVGPCRRQRFLGPGLGAVHSRGLPRTRSKAARAKRQSEDSDNGRYEHVIDRLHAGSLLLSALR